jgi:arylformamidase
MAMIDLTHPVENNMPAFPGEPGPNIRDIADIGNQGYRVKWLEMGSHTGTHMDAPAHLIPEGKTLDQFPVSHFSGKATIISVPSNIRIIEVSLLKQSEEKISESSFVLLKTGWSKFWGSDQYFRDFPVLSDEAAHWLVKHHLKGIGLDTVSADPVDSRTLLVHHIILKAGWVIY